MEERHIIATFGATLLLAAVHLLSRVVKQTEVGAYFRSFTAGMALSYVFMHILPDLADYQTKLLSVIEHRRLPWFDEHVYFFALAGLLFFYLLKGLARKGNRVMTAFRYDMFAASFDAYISGYIFAHREALGWPLALITGAFAAHYWSEDREMLELYGDRYRKHGALTLAGTIMAGWITGVLYHVSRQMLTALFAFLAGGIILISLRSELPDESVNHYAVLCLGAAFYTAVILWIDRIAWLHL
jgi:zinc transporter ZupT